MALIENQIITSWEDLKPWLDEDDQLLDDDRAELFDTGSVTLHIDGRQFVVALTVQEVK